MSSITRLPDPVARTICSYVEDGADLRSFSATCTFMRRIVVDDDRGWLQRLDPATIRRLKGHTQVYKQLEKMHFHEVELPARVAKAWLNGVQSGRKWHSFHLLVLSGNNVHGVMTYCIAPLSTRIITAMAYLPLCIPAKYHYSLLETDSRFSLYYQRIQIVMGVGYMIGGITLLPYFPVRGFLCLGAGYATVMRALDTKKVAIELSGDLHGYANVALVKTSAYAERAMRTTPCLKVASAIGSLKRSVIASIVRIAQAFRVTDCG